ncbi:uncharacterized protein N7515_004531 [Penicillium bovifimosum]|uniref:Uncharacterized protein n=1 Tax=Penicillium bovifimosum TaxID=126998 RepID=A0A9W9H0P0_9EURO|nr:uncharacterized protein N7515_004531 [Penicillium bovifimosum]KAJ5135253.1 hypothetical protein N7515_004531 [Penicillium bovifimosum]
MALPSRPTDFDARYIRRLVGTKITTFCDFEPLQQPSAQPVSSSTAAVLPLRPPPGASPSVIGRSLIITEKLSESAVHPSQPEVDMGVGSPMTIPITGTEDADLATLTQQIQPPEVCGELEAYKVLMSQYCSSVPRFLGYYEKTQGEHDLVPGGYVKYLVWEKVPGEPFTVKSFWSLGPLVRADIRAKFRTAFEDMLRCGVKPQESRISKIIYDQSTGNVSWPILDELQWSDTRYVAYMLANPLDERDWRSHPEKWQL